MPIQEVPDTYAILGCLANFSASAQLHIFFYGSCKDHNRRGFNYFEIFPVAELKSPGLGNRKTKPQ